MDFIRSFIESYLPPNYSAHGHHVDNLIVWTHYLMFVLFVGWGIYFIYALFKFRASNNSKANYEGVTSHYSTYIEGGIILFEAFLIFALALPKWQDLKLNIDKPKTEAIQASVLELRDTFLNIEGVVQDDITTFFPSNEINHDKQVIHVIAQAFNYNVHYPGPDGKFGDTELQLVSKDNPVGLNRSGFGADDVTTVNQLHLPVNKRVKLYISSKDVIHGFALPEMRVKQDAIPGMQVPIYFTPTMTTKEFLSKMKDRDPVRYNSKYGLDDETYQMFVDYQPEIIDEYRGYQIACAQLCGNGHATMRGFMKIYETEEEYLEAIAPKEEEEEEFFDDEDDDFFD